MPISATTISPDRARPGISRCPGFRRKNVTVSSAVTAPPSTIPVSPCIPLGTSTATQGAPASEIAEITASATPSSGRESPAPKSASTYRAAPSSTSTDSGNTSPSHRSALRRASPSSASLSPSSASVTGQPSAFSKRAITKPSPPLLPGPQTIRTGRPAHRRRISATTAVPAASIRRSPDVPAEMASRSASYICAVVRSS